MCRRRVGKNYCSGRGWNGADIENIEDGLSKIGGWRGIARN